MKTDSKLSKSLKVITFYLASTGKYVLGKVHRKSKRGTKIILPIFKFMS